MMVSGTKDVVNIQLGMQEARELAEMLTPELSVELGLALDYIEMTREEKREISWHKNQNVESTNK